MARKRSTTVMRIMAGSLSSALISILCSLRAGNKPISSVDLAFSCQAQAALAGEQVLLANYQVFPMPLDPAAWRGGMAFRPKADKNRKLDGVVP